MLFKIFEERGRSKKFAEHNKSYGFTEDRLAHLFLSEIISTFLRTTELFRICFLMTLTEKQDLNSRMTLGQLLRKLEEVSPKSKAITKRIDVKLRNALAHGLFWLEGTVLNYYEDIKFERERSISIAHLWNKIHEHSKITQCLINFIADWYTGT